MTPAAVITGASAGIGLELARLFAADGRDVVLVARDRERLDRLAGELRERHGVAAHAIAADLSATRAADAVVDELKQRGVVAEALVNNAGFALYGPFAEDDPARQAEMLAVNVVALTELTRRIVPGMLDRRAGRILNLASTAAFQPGPLMATYYATKAFVLSFSLGLSEELRGTGVTCTAFCPGPTATGFQARAEMAESRLVAGRTLPTAGHVASFGYRAMMKGKSLAVEGAGNRAFAFGTRLMPRPLAARIVMRAQQRVAP